MTDHNSSRNSGEARPITQLIRMQPEHRPQPPADAALPTIRDEDYDLRRREAGERERLNMVDRSRMGGDAPLWGERRRTKVEVVDAEMPSEAANDDRPVTARLPAPSSVVVPVPAEAPVALVPALPPTRLVRQPAPSARDLDDVGQTIMAMPQIIASQYDKAGRAKGRQRQRNQDRHADLIDAKRPMITIAGLAVVAALAVGGAMHLGGGLDALLAPSSNSPIRIASLNGLPIAVDAEAGSAAMDTQQLASAEQSLAVPVPVQVDRVVPGKSGELPSAAIVSDLPTSIEEQLLNRGAKLMDEGDIAGARSVYEVLSRQGSAAGAYGYARTFDPAAFRSRKVEGIRPDEVVAIEWYRRAAEAGNLEASARLMAIDAAQ